MWDDVKKRLAELKALDTNGLYNYEFPEPATDKEILALEAKIGIGLPEQMRSFYLEMGNGGPGPDAILFSLDKVDNLRADQPWLGCEYYGNLDDDFEDSACGLLTIMGAGYAHENAIVTNGDELGAIIAFNSLGGWMFVKSRSLIDFYHEGLDDTFSTFNEIKRLISDGQEVFDILLHFENAWRARAHPHNVLLRIASLIGLPFRYEPDTRPAISYIWFEKNAKGEEVPAIEKETEGTFNKQIKEYRRTAGSKQLSEIYRPERSR